MPDRLQLVGGPLDGHEITKPAGKYAWVRGTVSALPSLRVHDSYSRLRLLPGAKARFLRGAAASSRPRDGAALYEDVGGVLLYAGHRVTLCRDCGAYHGKCEGGREKRRCAFGDSG